MILDSRTASAGAGLLFSVLAASGVAIRQQRTTYPGFSRWIIANSLFACGMIIATLAPAMIDWVNIPLVVAMILSAEGNRAFLGLPPRLSWMYPTEILVAALVLYAALTHRPNTRHIEIGLLYVLPATVSAVSLLSSPPAGRKLGLRLTGGIYGVFTLGCVAWAVCSLSRGDIFLRLDASGAFYFLGVLSLLCCSIGWLVMTDDRRFAEWKEQEAKTQFVKESAAAVNAAKGELLAMVGHEIRNPLSAVLSLTDLMLETELTADQKDYEIGVRQSIDALLRVTDDVLDLSKIETGKLAVTLSPFDILALVDGVAKVFRPVARQKGLDLIVDYDEEMPRRFLGDAGRIRQVITNLVSNATKFTKEGQIRIAVGCRALTGSEFTIRVSVADNGIGIAPEMMGTLFDQFSSSHEATSNTYGGTGIGLAISKRLIKLMGGRLAADSVAGKGSTFWFELNLPVVNQAAGAKNSG